MTARRFRRALVLGGTALIFVFLAGATYQGVATALERRRFPHPGQLTSVGEHQLHLYCTGEGRPTVVLEAPAAGMSLAWSWVQPDIAAMTRVCSYDRAGLGWSEAGTGGFVPSAVPDQLHALLLGAGEHPPYILAGQGFGAALGVIEAGQFGSDLAALILIDRPQPEPAPDSGSLTRRLLEFSPWLARIGLLRVSGLLTGLATGMPDPQGKAFTAFLNRPDHLARSAAELSRRNDVLALAGTVRLDPSLPVVDVTASGSQHVAFLSTSEAAAPVIAAIRAAVGAARSGD